MNTILQKISKIKLVPVVKIDRVEDAIPLSESLISGGLPVAEITFRTEAAEQSIRQVAKKYPQMLIGAGTIVNTEQVKRAVDAGATFMVSPGFNHKVVEYCVQNNIAITPGICTPSELQWLIEYNLDVAKFFPAEQAGGLDMIKALAGPFPNMKFMPTGGINANNILSYLSFNKIIACGGSWMVKDNLIKSRNFEEIKRLTSEAVKLVCEMTKA